MNTKIYKRDFFSINIDFDICRIIISGNLMIARTTEFLIINQIIISASKSRIAYSDLYFFENRVIPLNFTKLIPVGDLNTTLCDSFSWSLSAKKIEEGEKHKRK